MTRLDLRGGFAAARRTAGALVAAVAFTASGCTMVEDVLSVDAPTQVPAAELDKPEHATLLVTGLVGDFECALAISPSMASPMCAFRSRT